MRNQAPFKGQFFGGQLEPLEQRNRGFLSARGGGRHH